MILSETHNHITLMMTDECCLVAMVTKLFTALPYKVGMLGGKNV